MIRSSPPIEFATIGYYQAETRAPGDRRTCDEPDATGIDAREHLEVAATAAATCARGHICVSNLDKTLRSFWEMENISEEKPVISDELKFSEEQFERTHNLSPTSLSTCVLRSGNPARPLRVVFNRSQKTDQNISLNDVLSKGDVVQDLFPIMLRARKHDYFFSCDIRHMFRQIEINPEERLFQKILWKQGPNEPIQIYKLKTVTYGTTPACYLSTRVLKQLAIDEEDNFPNAANIVR
ncbi:uncharacterized protein NPIL_121431 [Nephila pilipes]|uniref:Reverse transcriptase domain-containing protein n=1 Tax=Nephila pilipes TaxID=299642 RepID=A0A8X6P0T7_NEPPI|nr:uncharacterized protein NPIL_121431 [Nephila pilipes]